MGAAERSYSLTRTAGHHRPASSVNAAGTPTMPIATQQKSSPRAQGPNQEQWRKALNLLQPHSRRSGRQRKLAWVATPPRVRVTEPRNPATALA